jgi:hypothetical protein
VQAYNLRALALLGSSAGLLACSDSTSAPATSAPPATRMSRLPDALRTRYEALAGTAIITISRFDAAGGKVLVAADTGRFNASLAQFRTTTATVRFGSTTAKLDVAVDARAKLRRMSGSQTRTVGPNALSHRQTSVGDRPLSDGEFRRGGQLMARTHTDWERSGTYWIARRQTLTVYRNGVPVQTTVIAISGEPARLVDSPGAEADWSGGDEEGDPYAEDDENEGPCDLDALIEKMDEALLTYDAAVVVAAVMCASPALPACIAAGTALTAAYIRLVNAEKKAFKCYCSQSPNDPDCRAVVLYVAQGPRGGGIPPLRRPTFQPSARGAS